MRLSILLAAAMFPAGAPLAAQTAPAPAPAAQPEVAQAPAAKPQMVKKTICRRVEDEATTGSRVGPAPKVCKTVEVPAKDGAGNSSRAPSPERGL